VSRPRGFDMVRIQVREHAGRIDRTVRSRPVNLWWRFISRTSWGRFSRARRRSHA